jgi:hypothetical protein
MPQKKKEEEEEVRERIKSQPYQAPFHLGVEFGDKRSPANEIEKRTPRRKQINNEEKNSTKPK